jgi:hypothetical protein
LTLGAAGAALADPAGSSQTDSTKAIAKRFISFLPKVRILAAQGQRGHSPDEGR